MVITPNKVDLYDKGRFKYDIEISELSKINAARLLMLAAENSPHLKKYKTASELSKHEIFTMISFKPSGILQMAPLL